MFEQNFIENQLVILTKQTLDVFLRQENAAELIALYTFYYYTAKWQQTNQPKCTTDYVAKALHWNRGKVCKVKKQLVEFGLIEDVRIVDHVTKKVRGYYIKMNYIFKKETLEKSQCTSNPPTGNEVQGASVPENEGVAFEYTNALSTNNTNALSSNNLKKESKKERKKEFTRDGEEVSPPPSDDNSSDNYQKSTSKTFILYNSDQKKSFVEFDSLGKQSNNNSDDSLIADESKKERKKVPAKKKEKPKREIAKTFDDILDYYTSNQDIKDALIEFIKMRQRIRRPLTNRALTLNLGKLDELASDNEEKLEIIQQTIMNSWQSFYGINDFGKFKKKSPSYDLEKYKKESNQIKKDYGDSYTMTIGWGDD